MADAAPEVRRWLVDASNLSGMGGAAALPGWCRIPQDRLGALQNVHHVVRPAPVQVRDVPVLGEEPVVDQQHRCAE